MQRKCNNGSNAETLHLESGKIIQGTLVSETAKLRMHNRRPRCFLNESLHKIARIHKQRKNTTKIHRLALSNTLSHGNRAGTVCRCLTESLNLFSLLIDIEEKVSLLSGLFLNKTSSANRQLDYSTIFDNRTYRKKVDEIKVKLNLQFKIALTVNGRKSVFLD